MSSLLHLFLEDEFNESDDDIETAAVLMAKMESNKRPKHGGSMPGREVVRRNKQQGHAKLFDDYFADDPVFSPVTFRRRFRISKELFLRIVAAVEAHCPYFKQKRNAVGDLGHSALKKITAALRMLAYGVPADSLDDWLHIAESTIILSLKKFVKAVIESFGQWYLRAPNTEDTTRLMQMGESKGFPARICSSRIYYATSIQQPNTPFGLPGSHNDLNVLQRSHLFARLAAGNAPPVNFEVNGHHYTMGYYLVDGIYPSWSTFVKTIRNPQGNKRVHFAQAQEAARKDDERAFGVLQSRFAIVRGPARFWDQKTLWRIMTACVIMHNMIIEDERCQPEDFNYEHVGTAVTPEKDKNRIKKFLEAHRKIEDREAHDQLRDDLIEHLWQRHGQ